MSASVITFLVFLTSHSAYSQYAFPYGVQQNGLTNQVYQQQIPYFTQPSYYPVGQQIQQPLYYTGNGQVGNYLGSGQTGNYPGSGLTDIYPGNVRTGYYLGNGYYPYPYQVAGQNQQQLTQKPLEQVILQNAQIPQETSKLNQDPYANIQAEIIDINPDDFQKVLTQMNAKPTIVSYETRVLKTVPRKPHFTVTTQSRQSNQTSYPQTIHSSKTDSKVFTYNKTFVLHPGDDKNSVINLNFLNGDEITNSTSDRPNQDDTNANNPESVVKDEDTNDNDENTKTTSNISPPLQKGRRFIDVPAGCEDGSEAAITGGCFSPFKHHLNVTIPANITRTDEPTIIKADNH